MHSRLGSTSPMVSPVCRNIFLVFAKLILDVASYDISCCWVMNAKARFCYCITLQLDQTSLNSIKTSFLRESQQHDNDCINCFITPDLLQFELSLPKFTIWATANYNVILCHWPEMPEWRKSPSHQFISTVKCDRRMMCLWLNRQQR